MVKSTLFVIPTLALLVFAAGCNSSSTSPNTNDTTKRDTTKLMRMPGTGSVFVLRGHEIDSTGALEQPGGLITLTALASGISFLGKSNVVQFDNSNEPGDMVYFSYEVNGNLFMYDHSVWAEIPTGTAGERTTVRYDTNSNGDISKYEYKYTYAGTENVTLAGHTFSTVKVLLDERYWWNGQEDTDRGPQETLWFAKELGFIVKDTYPPHMRYGRMHGGFKAELESYVLK